jgi:acyl-coenzyme A thioesterase PaaI-like protein
MSFPFEVGFFEASDFALKINPQFPNWERSFVSGPDSPLFNIEHFIHPNDESKLMTTGSFKLKSEGPPGHVHGGASAALLDEVMGVLVWHQKYFCVTQSIQVHYRRALPLSTEAIVFTEIKARHPKTIEVHATIYDKEKTPYVSSQGVFHQLTADQLERFKSLA